MTTTFTLVLRATDVPAAGDWLRTAPRLPVPLAEVTVPMTSPALVSVIRACRAVWPTTLGTVTRAAAGVVGLLGVVGDLAGEGGEGEIVGHRETYEFLCIPM